jgi:hypothetical protein
VAVQVEEIECKVSESLGSPLGNRGVQRIDMRHAAFVRHRNLAVEHQRRQPGGCQCAERFAEQLGAVSRIAAEQPDGAVGDNRYQTVAVVFYLVKPAAAVRRLRRK